MANDDAVIKRILPHSEAAEQSVIGSMMMDKQAILTASEIVTREDFYQQQYGILFEAMVELYNAGKEVDPVTLQNHLREKKVPKEISDMEYVRDLLNVVPTSANIKHYAEIVAEKATLRRLIRAAEEVTNNCYMDDQPLEQLMEESEKKMFQVFQQKNASDFESIKSIVMKTLDTIEKASHTSGNVTGHATGFTDLDFKTSGMQPSDLILIAARPSMGKTAFVLNIAQYMAFHHGKHVAIFSLEMSKQQLVTRMMSMESHVGSQSLRNGKLKDDEWKQLIETAGVIGESNLIIDDTPGITIREMRSKCRKYKLEHGLDIIMIDYLQLMSGSGGKSSESRQQEPSSRMPTW